MAQSCVFRVCASRRYTHFSVLALVLLVGLPFIVPHESRTWFTSPRSCLPSGYPSYPIPRETPLSLPSDLDVPLPPLYERYTSYQDSFPQHDKTLPSPEGSNAKFMYFANQAWGARWGNIMQQIVMNGQLAYASDRTFVFDSYTWKRDGEYADYNGKPIPSQIPLSALLAGPLVGYPYVDSTIAHTHPRAVSRHYYDYVCPDPYILDSSAIIDTLPLNITALETMNVWINKLRSISDRCVEIKKDTPQLFDIWLFGTPRLHDIVPTVLNSPLLKDFAWAPLIHYAFQKNLHHFSPSTLGAKNRLGKLLLSYISRNGDSSSHYNYWSGRRLTLSPTQSTTKADPLPLLAIHLRRGDFIEHCDNLVSWNSTYHGYNTLPSLPDRFFAENSTLLDTLPPDELKKRYREKCLVDIDMVRRRVVQVVREWRSERLKIEESKTKNNRFSAKETRIKKMLRKIYIMTNGDHNFLQELKEGLQVDALRSSSTAADDPGLLTEFDYDFVWDWDEISTSRDLDLGWETKYVAQAMDMYVGQRAELFIGNGFSSLTANVVLMRLVAGVEPWRTRFW